MSKGKGQNMRWTLSSGVLVLIALAFAGGRISAPADEGSDPSLSVPADLKAELNADQAHSAAGAVLAMAAYQRAFADPSILEPGVLEARVKAVATPDFAPKMLEATRPGTDRLIEGPLGAEVSQGTPIVYFGVPVSYRLLSYAPERARIQNWGFTMIGGESTVEPEAYFGTATYELVWQDGKWKVAHTRGAFGPTPETLTPREGGEGFELQDLARDFKPYGLAP